MASPTRLDFIAGGSGHAVAGASRHRVRRPVRHRALRGRAGKAFVLLVRRAPPGRPGHMALGRTMAAFTSDADLREGAVEAVGRRIVALANGRRMAVRAHEIPILLPSGPMKHVTRWDGFVRIEMDPALSAL